MSETKIKQFEDLSMVPKLEVVHTRHGNLQLGLGEILSQMDSSGGKIHPRCVREFRCVSTFPKLT